MNKLVYFVCGALSMLILFWIFSIFGCGQTGNVLENSSLFGGYSEIEVYEIFDSKTGVMYAVTDGGICVMVDDEGKPRLVD